MTKDSGVDPLHVEPKATMQFEGVALTSSSAVVIVLGIVLSCSILITPSECITLSPVYWNLSNPIFKSSKNDHIISVNPFDEIDFVCPFHSVQQPTTDGTTNSTSTSTTTRGHQSNMEFYLIYQVSKSEYDECSIFSENIARLILSCTQPKHRRRFTIWFDPFQSVPRVPEYKAGQSYYFITSSDGHQSGLDNLYQGACFHHNMKLTIRIRDFVQNEDDSSSHQPTGSVSSRHVIDDVQPKDQDDVMSHHHPRRHQQLQPQNPVLHQNNRSSSSSVYSRHNLSRHLPVMTSSSSLLPPPPPRPTSVASDDLQDKAAPAQQTPLQAKETERQQPKKHLRVSQEQIKKPVFNPKPEEFAFSSSSSTASLLSAHVNHSFQLLFPFGHYLCIVTFAVIYLLIQSCRNE